MRRATVVLGIVVVAVSVACSGDGDHSDQGPPLRPVRTAAPPPVVEGRGTALPTAGPTGTPTSPSGAQPAVTVEAQLEIGPISPLIRGFSGGVDEHFLRDVGATVNSWGGNPATRFNYELGHAWNAAADWEYRNGNYGQAGDAARDFIVESHSGGAAVRLAVPTLGWVAKNDNSNTCSFPSRDGCGGADLDCENPGAVADPTLANVASTPEMVRAWVELLTVNDGLPVEFIAMDNEPELWGHTHYDVHPSCTTYEEVLDKYLTYADAVREVAPDAQLLGPVSCCWYDFWGTAPGTADGRDVDYLTWFLEQVRRHDERIGARSLHLLDVHYYPQSEVYNDATDADTAARRLRSTRSLWDPTYADESWIGMPIEFIPRMHETIAAAYPGTGLAISEWNFGADTTVNGALVIADVLAIYGREGVELASYWRHPPPASPGYFAFKMHGNYDGRGSSFTGVAVETTTPDVDRLASYAAIDRENGLLRVMLINKVPDRGVTVPVSIDGAGLQTTANLYRYADARPTEIVHEELIAGADSFTLELPASSITLVELALAA